MTSQQRLSQYISTHLTTPICESIQNRQHYVANHNIVHPCFRIVNGFIDEYLKHTVITYDEYDDVCGEMRSIENIVCECDIPLYGLCNKIKNRIKVDTYTYVKSANKHN